MSNLFSAFEPTAIFGLSLNWLSSFFLLMLIPSRLFLAPSRHSEGYSQALKTLVKEFKSVLGLSVMPGSTWFLMALFLFIFLNNILGLFPYIFTSTSHMSMGLSLAFPLWVGHMVYSWFKQPQFALAHLVPLGTPPALMSFMVLIEVISNVIRPITLSVRLMANLTAGHLLLCLLSSNMGTSVFSLSAAAVVLGLCLLMILEVAVSLIQAYVFTLLSSLYLEEVQTPVIMK